jgi:hypothetical protein
MMDSREMPRENDPLHAPINIQLASIVETSSSKPAWYEDWLRLGPESAEEERLALIACPGKQGFTWCLGRSTP